MTIRIDYPFTATFEMGDPGTNSREVRTQFLQTYLLSSGLDFPGDVETFQVISFNGEDNGEFWQVKAGN